MTVARVRIQGRVGDDHESGTSVFDGGHGAWNQAGRVHRLFAGGRTQGIVHVREDGHRRYPEVDATLRILDEPIHAQAVDVGHRLDRFGEASFLR